MLNIRKVKVLNFDFHKQFLKGNINIENVAAGYPGGGRNDPGLEFQVRLKKKKKKKKSEPKRDELVKQLGSTPIITMYLPPKVLWSLIPSTTN